MSICDVMREGLFARVDGQPSPVAGLHLDEHVADCGACRLWSAVAQGLRDQVYADRVHAPEPGPINPAVAPKPGERSQTCRRGPHERHRILRFALAATSLAQLCLALPALAGPGVVHGAREVASFDVAVAVGFGLAAWLPQRARAFVPVAFVLAACLAVTSVSDVVGGITALPMETGHIATVAQALLLWALSRTASRQARQPITVTGSAS
ncbi:hypothetical protein AB0B66_09950 [Catellatospora sp. NPDC049111]|uniref:hypothetical protein n=1 Tax=Catellatospora sp. NPDC049111 TaxID=3155271 RepID=UPI0033C790D3